ncbi:MAG: glycine cleavage system aminomethyltransferase GcvT [Planctomycetes bacterium]|jgi:aminomethyltransferase|nr:glycine cleavage system aminomethyltransferase GcvT [Planctomycetota bacterium]MBT4029236.1 glycine cleavage system aminomethyltransferase GcvT [Planctomycetota bacterium]MBT4560678.1 glycine cleavage system aminomethyltransferase GcvT [Planctomycetota bacterium]
MNHSETLLQTPLASAHKALGAKLVPFAGWEMPLDYGSILGESRATRESAGLFDVGHMARIWFRGPNVAAELDHALGGCITDQPIGKARYTMILAEDGGILDDLITYRTGQDEFFMVVNAANRHRDLEILRSRITESTIDDITEDGGCILALQGPDSVRILQELCDDADLSPGFLDLAWPGSPFGQLFVARTGYTGELGYEIFTTAEQSNAIWQRILELGASPVGLGARDVLRLEAAMPLYGHEIHEDITPFDAGLRFAVRGWKTREFIGSSALQAAAPSSKKLIGFTTDKRVPRDGYPVLANGIEVGQICSGAFSATLQKPIATAYVPLDCDGPFTVSFRGKEMPVDVAVLPFVPHRSRD